MNKGEGGCCDNPQPLEEYHAELHAKVTTCVNCGTGVDYRPLRAKDEPSDEQDPLAETKGVDPAPPAVEPEDDLFDMTGTVAREPAPVPFIDGVSSMQGFACSEDDPCDTGACQANRCKHSKWGSAKTCAGPCYCSACHALPAQEFV
jgi:hypothetical protein